MKSLLSLFGLGSSQDESTKDTATVRRILAELEHLDTDRARYIAAFAYALSRVAHADLTITADEVTAMETIVREHGKLPEAQAVLVVEIARHQAELFGGTENFQVIRQLRDLANETQQTEIIDALFAVAAADGSIGAEEETQIRLIADELGLSRGRYIDLRSRWNEQRSVIQRLDG
ncbi:MAG: TerB family tellurite resistance protein [Acidobacteriota bacterium]